MMSVKNTTQKKQILPRNDHLCQIEMVDKFKLSSHIIANILHLK